MQSLFMTNKPAIAVCFSGWLNVAIPADGRDARENLVNPLAAEVFVAGTFLPSDCPADASSGRCLTSRLRGLQPLHLSLVPMLTASELRAVLASRYSSQLLHTIERVHGLRGLNRTGSASPTLWTPAFGDPRLSVLRQMHDAWRVLRLVETHEAARGVKYQRLVFSRLEFEWLAPHPPIELLQPSHDVWIPADTYRAVTDRHGVLDRAAAEVYLKHRWELLLSPSNLSAHVPWLRADPARVVHLAANAAKFFMHGPEDFLQAVLRARGLRVRHFPGTMAIACCEPRVVAAGRCFRARGQPRCNTFKGVRDASQLPSSYASGWLSRPPHPQAHPPPSTPHQADFRFKYPIEGLLALAHARALACPGATYARAEQGEANVPVATSGALRIHVPAFVSARTWLPSTSIGYEELDASTAATGAGEPKPAQGVKGADKGEADGGRRRDVHLSTRASAPVETPWTVLVRADAAIERRELGALGRGGKDFVTPYEAQRFDWTDEDRRRDPAELAGMARTAMPLHCPLLPRHWWPHGAVRGRCGVALNLGMASATTGPGGGGGGSGGGGGGSGISGRGSSGGGGNDCTSGESGGFSSFRSYAVRQGGLSGLPECIRRCAECRQCHYVSVATEVSSGACLWFRACDLAAVDAAAAGARTRSTNSTLSSSSMRRLQHDPHRGFVSMALLDALRFDAACRARYGARGACASG